MKITIIGGTGLMGPFLVKRLVDAGHLVTCINRRGQSSCDSVIACDRRDRNALAKVMASLEHDVIIDMIPFIQSDAEIVCEIFADRKDIKLVTVSSIDVYQAYGRLHRTETGPYQKCPISETDPLRELPSIRQEYYDKIGVERAYLKHFKNVSILRMPAIYGWPDTSRIQRYFDALPNEDKTLKMHPLLANWGFTRASAPDCAYAIFLTLEQTGQHIYNVGEEELLSEEAWCHAIWTAAGEKGNIVYDESAEIPFDVDLKQCWHVDTQKIRKELGYQETTNRSEILAHNIRELRKSENLAAR